MKAILLQDIDGRKNMLWQEVEIPKPTYSGQVLIKVKAAGVNRPDVLQRQGLYDPPADASPYMGLEISGIIETVYETDLWKVGDHVCGLTHGGGYAEYVWVDAEHCLPIPSGFSFEQAASLPETFFTVWFNVFMQGELGKEKSETLLIHAASSGIGVAAIQMAKALGNTVFVTARREAQLQKCIEIGADEKFLLNEDWPEMVKRKSKGVDVVLDMLGKSTVEGNIEVLNQKGRCVWIAYLTGNSATLPIAKVMKKQLRFTGSFLRPQTNMTKAMIAKELRENIWPKIEDQTIKPVIEKVFPIDDVTEAHQLMEEGGIVGKIILKV